MVRILTLFLFVSVDFIIPSVIKERVHSEMKTCDKLDYCPHIQPITFPSQKNPPFCPDRVSVSKFCTSGTCITPSEDLHHTIRGPASHHPRPASHHPRTCITPFEDLHHTIQGPAADRSDGPAVNVS